MPRTRNASACAPHAHRTCRTSSSTSSPATTSSAPRRALADAADATGAALHAPLAAELGRLWNLGARFGLDVGQLREQLEDEDEAPVLVLGTEAEAEALGPPPRPKAIPNATRVLSIRARRHLEDIASYRAFVCSRTLHARPHSSRWHMMAVTRVSQLFTGPDRPPSALARKARQLLRLQPTECNHPPPVRCAGSSSRLRVRGALVQCSVGGSAFLYSKHYIIINSKHYIDENKVTRCRSVRAPDPDRSTTHRAHLRPPDRGTESPKSQIYAWILPLPLSSAG